MKVLFICEGNMVRSQIAEAFYNSLTNSHDASSAGTAATRRPAASRRAIAVMDELGVSLDSHFSKDVTQVAVDEADKVILFPVTAEPAYLRDSRKVERWDISDLGFGVEDSVALDRNVRDYVKERVEKLVEASRG